MIEIELPDGTVVEFPEGTSQEAMMTALAGLGYGRPAAQADTPEQTRIKELTDQARAAYGAGNDEEGKRLLVEASRLSADSGLAPEGFTADPRTGGMVDLRGDPTIPVNAYGPDALMIGAAQGLGYNFADEAVGAMAGAANAMGLGDGTDARFAIERMRETDRRAQEENPVAYYGGMIPGAVASSLTLGKALGLGPAMQGTLGQRSIAGAGLGVTEGALAGAGGGETTEERIHNAIMFGGIGLGVGGLAPGALALGGQVIDGIGGVAASMRSAPSEIRASRALERALRRSGMSADEVQQALARAAAEGQPEFVVADALGRPGQRLLGSTYRTADEAQGEIIDFLTSRNAAQPERLSGFVDDAFDLGGETARAARNSVVSARDEAADLTFGNIRSNGNPVDIRGVLSEIDTRVAPFAEANIDSPTRRALENLRGQLAGQSDNATYELSDFNKVFAIRKDLKDAITASYREGRNELAGQLKAIRNAMDDALQGSNDQYRGAMKDFATQSRVAEAFDTGAEMLRPSNRAADNTTAFQAMTPEQQAAARAGYGDRLLARVEAATGENVNRARALNSPKVAQEAGVIATDPALLKSRIGRENTMFETSRRVIGGSETAERLADDAGLDAQSMGVLANTLRGNVGEAAIQLGLRGAQTLQGRNTATREMIARMLMGQDIQRAIAPALAAEAKAGPRRAVIEALVRGLPRPATN